MVTQIKIREECEERERRKQREKEKKEANEALLQELMEWEKKHLTSDHLKQLHSMWEVSKVKFKLTPTQALFMAISTGPLYWHQIRE